MRARGTAWAKAGVIALAFATVVVGCRETTYQRALRAAREAPPQVEPPPGKSKSSAGKSALDLVTTPRKPERGTGGSGH